MKDSPGLVHHRLFHGLRPASWPGSLLDARLPHRRDGPQTRRRRGSCGLDQRPGTQAGRDPSPSQVAAAVEHGSRLASGGIDVLVNNAGIGYFAAVEEGEEARECAGCSMINVFGLSRMIQAVLPGMRQRRGGCIVNIASIGGLRSFPAVGYYNATKYAVEGLSEALWTISRAFSLSSAGTIYQGEWLVLVAPMHSSYAFM
jgi:NAD(P)-dependent dehydrogenase (short-subunit alcohol dehydrogenase family)